jgi:hypothetical protein
VGILRALLTKPEQRKEQHAGQDQELTDTHLGERIPRIPHALYGNTSVLDYFNHEYLVDAGITIEGDPDKNVLYTTAGRLLAMIGASIFVLVTQNPAQHAVVWFMSILREGQEMFIDPLFPYANSPAAPIVDFGMHVVIVALEIAAFVTVYRLARHESRNALEPAGPVAL